MKPYFRHDAAGMLHPVIAAAAILAFGTRSLWIGRCRSSVHFRPF